MKNIKLGRRTWEWALTDMSVALNSGAVIVSAGRIIIHNELALGVHCKILPGGLIQSHILIADMTSVKTHDDPTKYLTFEMVEFGVSAIANQTVPFGTIIHSIKKHASVKADDLVTSLLHCIVSNFCRRIIFHVTLVGVWCEVMLNNGQTLRATNDYKWNPEWEMLEHFFSRR